MASPKFVLAAGAKAWGFMNIQSQTVACSVKETLHAASVQPGLESLFGKVSQDFVVDVVGTRVVPDPPEADALSFFDTSVSVSQTF
jgi:hypothetical protein